jgi:hypothetical protein
MFDYEGSRGEFLKLLVELGEKPAFIARAQAPMIALNALLSAVEAKRREMLKWPTFHLSILANQIKNDWSRLGSLLAVPESSIVLETLYASMHTGKPVRTGWLGSDKSALRRFLESGERFNRNWQTYLDGLDLGPVNKPRRDFNEFYVLEKACAFGSERIAEAFEPLEMIDSRYLYERLPFLTLPSLA